MTDPDSLNSKATLLIAEDNHDLREAMVMLLEEDYQVIEAQDGGEALQCLRQQQPPQLVLLDINMPVLTGIEVLESLTPETVKASRVVIHSGHLDARVEQHCLSLGAFALLRKPVGFNVLTETLQAALQARA